METIKDYLEKRNRLTKVDGKISNRFLKNKTLNIIYEDRKERTEEEKNKIYLDNIAKHIEELNKEIFMERHNIEI